MSPLRSAVLAIVVIGAFAAAFEDEWAEDSSFQDRYTHPSSMKHCNADSLKARYAAAKEVMAAI